MQSHMYAVLHVPRTHPLSQRNHFDLLSLYLSKVSLCRYTQIQIYFYFLYIQKYTVVYHICFV